jgi:hypothetical protein
VSSALLVASQYQLQIFSLAQHIENLQDHHQAKKRFHTFAALRFTKYSRVFSLLNSSAGWRFAIYLVFAAVILNASFQLSRPTDALYG